MKNILAILAALALFSVSTTVFAGEGPLALPKGADDKQKNIMWRVSIIGNKGIMTLL